MAQTSTRQIESTSTVMANGYAKSFPSDLIIANNLQVYAVVTGCLSAITCILYMIPFMSRIPFAFLWDTILFILWIALFGLFGSMYIKENAEGDAGVKRMKNAVWVDLVNALLWLISAVGMAMYWIKHRNNRTRFTGRATV